MPRMKSDEEYASSGTGDYGMLDDGEYIVNIDSFSRVNRVSQYNPDGLETLDFYLTPKAFADVPDDELTDVDGNALNPDMHLLFFADERKMGTRPMVSRTRKFVASALQVPIDEALSFEWNDLIGKDVIVEVATKNGRNRVTNVKPLKKARSRRAAAPLVAAASEIFDTESKDDHDSLPF